MAAVALPRLRATGRGRASAWRGGSILPPRAGGCRGFAGAAWLQPGGAAPVALSIFSWRGGTVGSPGASRGRGCVPGRGARGPCCHSVSWLGSRRSLFFSPRGRSARKFATYLCRPRRVGPRRQEHPRPPGFAVLRRAGSGGGAAGALGRARCSRVRAGRRVLQPGAGGDAPWGAPRGRGAGRGWQRRSRCGLPGARRAERRGRGGRERALLPRRRRCPG